MSAPPIGGESGGTPRRGVEPKTRRAEGAEPRITKRACGQAEGSFWWEKERVVVGSEGVGVVSVIVVGAVSVVVVSSGEKKISMIGL